MRKPESVRLPSRYGCQEPSIGNFFRPPRVGPLTRPREILDVSGNICAIREEICRKKVSEFIYKLFRPRPHPRRAHWR
jgi:hypothetical protein